MVAEIAVFPLDKGGSGLSKYVAGSVKLMKDSGLDHELNAMGTVVEGPADSVFDLIRKLHENMASKCDRVIMDIAASVPPRECPARNICSLSVSL